jgi:hypothetical protein
VGKDRVTDLRSAERIKSQDRNEELGDFTTSLRVVPISLLAVVSGAVCAFVALALLRRDRDGNTGNELREALGAKSRE